MKKQLIYVLVILAAGLLWLVPAGAQGPVIPELMEKLSDLSMDDTGHLPGANFGFSISATADTAVVGAPGLEPGKAGRVYLFRYLAARDKWYHWQTLEPEDMASEPYFGSTLAMEGDILAVGSWKSGVYIYKKNAGNIWTLRQKITASGTGGNPSATEDIGRFVDIENRTLAFTADTGTGGSAVYLYKEDAGTWARDQRIPRAQDPDLMKIGAMDMSVNHIAFTQPGENHGTVVIYRRPSETQDYGFEDKISRTGHWPSFNPADYSFGKSHDFLGRALSMDGDLIAVGDTHCRNIIDKGDSSALWVFKRAPGASGAGSWQFDIHFLPSDIGYEKKDFLGLGTYIHLTGNRLAAGAPLDPRQSTVRYHGEAFFFERYLDPGDGQYKWFIDAFMGADFGPDTGRAVFLHPEAAPYRIWVGGWQHEENNFSHVAALIRECTGSPPTCFWNDGTLREDWYLGGGYPSRFGKSLDLDGDIAVVGAPAGNDDWQHTPGPGRAFVFIKNEGVWEYHAELGPLPAMDTHGFGTGISVRGNTIIVGSPYEFDPDAPQDKGRVYVFEWNDQAGTWGLKERIQKVPDPDFTRASFGRRLFYNGQWMAVEEDNENTQGNTLGRLSIYRNSGAGFVYHTCLNISGASRAWAMDENRLVFYQFGMPPELLVYTLAADDMAQTYTVALEDTITQHNPGISSYFGQNPEALAINGETIAVGDFEVDRVWIYERTEPVPGVTKWVQTQEISQPLGSEIWSFGAGVALEENSLTILGHEGSGEYNNTVWLYQKRGSLWPAAPAAFFKLAADNNYTMGRIRLSGSEILGSGYNYAMDMQYPFWSGSGIMAPVGRTIAPDRIAAYVEPRLQDETTGIFRYIDQLYAPDSLLPNTAINTFYTEDEFYRSLELEGIVADALTGSGANLSDSGLRDLLLDFYYHRTRAAAMMAGNELDRAKKVRLEISMPDCGGDTVLDREICFMEKALERYYHALGAGITQGTAGMGGGYFDLLMNDLGQGAGGIPLGYEIFKAQVPGRAYAVDGQNNPVNLDAAQCGADPACSVVLPGYKDLVLLMGLLRDTGEAARGLSELLMLRDNPKVGDQPSDRAAAADVCSRAQSLLFTLGHALLGSFTPSQLADLDSDSGFDQHRSGWEQALADLTLAVQTGSGNANPLGFNTDFLIFFPKHEFTEHFDSFDIFQEYLNPDGTKPNILKTAIEAHTAARASFETYLATKEQIQTELESLDDTYKLRLRELVGADYGTPEYDQALLVPGDFPAGEINRQRLNIELAKNAIERNREEINNIHRQVKIEIERRARARGVENAMQSLYIRYGNKQARLTEEIGAIEAAQAAADSFLGGFCFDSPFKFVASAVTGAVNGAIQGVSEDLKSSKEAEKERLAAQQDAEIVALEARLADIDSDAQIKSWFLEMHLLSIDSQDNVLLLRQEIGQLKAMLMEKKRLETQFDESRGHLAARYFADPIHRFREINDVAAANAAFTAAQKWLFFMKRALEYKYNVPFKCRYGDPCHTTREWESDSVFKLRNSLELEELYHAMGLFERIFTQGDEDMVTLSLKDDILGYRDIDGDGNPAFYEDPTGSGAMVDAITAFRNRLKAETTEAGDPLVRFTTVKDFDRLLGIPFFRKTHTLDKINWLHVTLAGGDIFPGDKISGGIKYGGTSFFRGPGAPEYDPDTDRYADDLISYPARYWVQDGATGKYYVRTPRLEEVSFYVNADPPMGCNDGLYDKVNIFKERSVATSEWAISFSQSARIDEIDDIKISICHRYKLRP